jgi:phenylalanyl-tRNA synthetase beta chain
MKVSEKWLREWINPAFSTEVVCQKMTMAGLELEGIEPVCSFQGVIVARVEHVEKHAGADKLSVCQVNTGAERLTIVCGAHNVRAGLFVALATVGAQLPGMTIKLAAVRGVESSGMLCSAVELGLADQADGIMELADDAPLGQDFITYYELDDRVLDFSITPNRGDATSVRGLAREIHALTGNAMSAPTVRATTATIDDQLPVKRQSDACTHYSCRIIRGIDNTVSTPIWLTERLRRSGIRPISPVVDVTNYVMLELGQPMHSFDLSAIDGGICVRNACAGEKLTLLDGQEKIVDQHTLVIADERGVLAMAGIMGGLDSGVNAQSVDVLLESACFEPQAIARSARHYRLSSESAYRFERGVDATLQEHALERATELLLAIVGGQVGPVVTQAASIEAQTIALRRHRLDQALGFVIEDADVSRILTALGFNVTRTESGWQVSALPFRYDITMEMDLIEEVLRIYGYDLIPERLPKADMGHDESLRNALPVRSLQEQLSSLGYREIISYSFVDEKIESMLGNHQPVTLLNPASKEMSVMRSSLLSGLLRALQYNLNRQQDRVRLFEYGLCFSKKDALTQVPFIGGVACGTRLPLQWGEKVTPLDFYDMKHDVEQLLAVHVPVGELSYKPTQSTYYHPGQAADIYRGDQLIGHLGALHPEICKKLKLKGRVYAFEVALQAVCVDKPCQYQPVSKYPEIRRDLAFYVDQSVSHDDLMGFRQALPLELLKNVFIFDIYQGEGVPESKKSCAMALILQHSSRTLVDEEVNNVVERIVEWLEVEHKAQLRD